METAPSVYTCDYTIGRYPRVNLPAYSSEYFSTGTFFWKLIEQGESAEEIERMIAMIDSLSYKHEVKLNNNLHIDT